MVNPNVLRKKVLDMVYEKKSGHIGGSFSMAELTSVLYDDYDIGGKDKFILSKGHAVPIIYAALHETGQITDEELDLFREIDSPLQGHPDKLRLPLLDATTGSLGHGLSIGIGIALSLKIKKRKSKVYIVLGDGEMNEGSVWEGLMSASKHKLDNLVVIVDHNNLQTYGSPEEVAGLSNIKDKMRSFGFRVKEVDGHSTKDIKKALKNKKNNSKRPLGLICKTIKGKGIDFAENQLDWHHKANLDDLTIKNIYNSLNKIS